VHRALRRTLRPAAVAVGLLALGACSLPFTGSAGAPASARPDQPAAKGAISRLIANQTQGLGNVLTDQSGFTLYRFEKDSIAPPASNCAAQCAVTWPPVLVPGGRVEVKGVERSLVGTITRADGATQLTVAGHPVYRYNQDKAPGDVNGQGVGQTWFALTPAGERAAAASTGATLSTAAAPGLGTIVTDADGFTLYRFDRDKAEPSMTNCLAACAETWPPAVVTTDKLTLNGVHPSVVGTILRADGTRQLTINGWPVYGYAGDKAQGDVKGQGIGGTWFAVTPAGGKSTGQATSPPDAGTVAAATGGY
jgi:predicted lipoprotein with Yx(FWY)xxD motif